MAGPIRLTQKDGDDIKASKLRGVDLAKMYGVSTATICDIRKGRSWQNKPKPETARMTAKAAGMLHYLPEKPCKSGHMSKRLVSDRSCSVCALIKKRAQYPLIRDAENERSRKYRSENREKVNASVTVWRKNNREVARAATREWSKKNPERVKAITMARRAREMGADGKLTPQDVREITAAQGGKCAYCKKKTKMTVDHIIPLIQGGSHSRQNIQMTCKTCNSSKGGRHPIEFAQKLGLLL